MRACSRFTSLMPGLVACLAIGLIGAADPLRATMIELDDGLAHSIPGDPAFADGDAITLSNASRLALETPAVVAGADDLTGTQRIGGPALTTAPGTTAMIRGGTIEGGLATASFQGTPATSPVAVGGAGIDQGGVLTLESGVVAGGTATALAVPTASRSEADGGPALVATSGLVVLGPGEF